MVNLGRATLRALSSNAAGAATKAVVQLAYTVILARLLGPAPFGLVAAAWVILGFAQLVATFGFGAALIQKKEISNDEVRYAFTMQTLLGIVATVALIFLAEPIAGAFKSPELVAVILYLSPILPLTAAAKVSLSLLRRDLRFGRVQIVLVASNAVSFLFVGIPLALAEFGVWSLVWTFLCQSFLQLTLAYLYTRHPVAPKFTLRNKALFNFGKIVFLINLLNYMIQQAENLVIGLYYGMSDLGTYNRAQALVGIPANWIVGIYRPVLFSMSSRAQDRKEILAIVYLSVLSLIGVTAFPVFIVAAILSETMIKGVFGDAWLDAIPLLVPLALAQSMQIATGIGGPILWGIGRPEKALKVSTVTFAVLVVVLGTLSQVSLLAIAWGMFAVRTFRFLLMTHSISKLFNIRLRQFYRAIRGGLLMCLACSSVAFEADHLLADRNIVPHVLLMLELGLVSVVYILLVLVRPQLFIGPYAMDLVRRYAHVIPDKLQFAVRLLRLRAAA